MSTQLEQDNLSTSIGKSVPRREGPEKVSGKAVYTDDMSVNGMLHGALLGSPYPHARIVSIDKSKAEALPGVKAVLVGEDLPLNYIGMFIKDQLALARDKVMYVGDPVAAVAATEVSVAKKALRLIEIEYEELEAVLDPEAALLAESPVIHEKRADYPTMFELPKEPNGCCYTELMEGDPASAWDQCDVIVEDEYIVPAQYHMYMEPVSTLADIDGQRKNNHLVIHAKCGAGSDVRICGNGFADEPGQSYRTTNRWWFRWKM